VTIPLLLDRYQIPQDVMPLFLIPGFITMRLGDLVGVFHLMTLTVVTSMMLRGRLKIQLRRLALVSAMLVPALLVVVVSFRALLRATVIPDATEARFLSLEILSPSGDVAVLPSSPTDLTDSATGGSALQMIRDEQVLRVGFQADHLPYSFFNSSGDLVGMDVELMHRLATQLRVRLEFVPWTYDTVLEQLDRGEFDVAVGGLLVTPQRLTRVAFCEPYQTATVAIVLKDDLRNDVTHWETLRKDLRLAVVGEELSRAADRQLPEAEIVPFPSVGDFFHKPHPDVDGLIIAAEEAAAWTMLNPEYTAVIPRPEVRRPVAMAIRLGDEEWGRFLDRWIEFERSDGVLKQLREYWVEGGGTRRRPPRWSILRNVLGWTLDKSD
jgi:ABC-type amino acid transport substrate-binding protein